jgi:hypothetical protein
LRALRRRRRRRSQNICGGVEWWLLAVLISTPPLADRAAAREESCREAVALPRLRLLLPPVFAESDALRSGMHRVAVDAVRLLLGREVFVGDDEEKMT